MGDNNEQEVVDLDAIIDAGAADLFEVIYRGDRLVVNIPDDVLISLIIDLSVTEIDDDACEGCRRLTEVRLHPGVIKIGRRAFQNCSQLQRIELPEGLLSIEEDAFFGCDSLREIVIPASVQYIGHEVFSCCAVLQRVVFLPRTASIELGRGIFDDCSHLEFVTLPHNLRSIPAEFFYACTSLTHLQIPVSVEQIGEFAFKGSGIQAMNSSVGDDFMPGTIILPPNLHSIADGCFIKCKSLTQIRIPPSVQKIGAGALSGSDLRSIEIPETVHRIGREALRDCSSLQEVTFHSSTTLLMDNDILAHCPLLSVIKIAPWLWPTLFSSMNGHPEFIFKFFRQYHTKIFDFNDWWVNRNVNQS